jgi:hypothetical protein
MVYAGQWRTLAEAHCFRNPAGQGLIPLTDSQLANRLDVDERTIRKWKSGQTRMVYTTWCCLCWLAGLGMPLDNIISD